MDNTQADFALNLAKQTKSHAEWLSVMRFGMAQLLDDQITLIECIFTEAQVESTRKENVRNSQIVAHIAWEIFEELNLKVVLDA